jgi:hypothetical protein
MISMRQARHSVWYRAAPEPIDPTTVILFTGLVAEVIVPWAVIWLSDLFFFDVPAWSQSIIFGGPPALGLLAMLIHLDLRRWSKQLLRAPVCTRSKRA